LLFLVELVGWKFCFFDNHLLSGFGTLIVACSSKDFHFPGSGVFKQKTAAKPVRAY